MNHEFLDLVDEDGNPTGQREDRDDIGTVYHIFPDLSNKIRHSGRYSAVRWNCSP